MRAFIISLALLVSAPALADSSAGRLVCDNRAKAQHFKTVVDYTRCLNKADAAVIPSNNQHLPLLKAYWSRKLAIAERVDRRLTTFIEASAEHDTLYAEVMKEIRRQEPQAQPALPQQQIVIQQAQPKAMTFCNTLGFSTICY